MSASSWSTASSLSPWMMALASSLVLTDVVGSWRTAVTVLADALAFTDESDGHWLQIFQDTLSLTDLVQNQITSTLVDSLILTTTVSNSVSLVLVFDDSLAFTDDLSALRTALMSLSDSVILGGIVNVEDEVYDAWVLNTETLGAWKYSNYPFNSFAQFQGRYYGCTNDGIYEITGDSDSGDDIDMTVRTGLMDFGSTQLKRIPRAYLGFQADGDLLFKTVDTASGEKIEKWHRLSTKTANAPTSTRIKLGRGTRARYWQFVIENIDGADVKIDDLRLFPILLKRRV